MNQEEMTRIVKEELRHIPSGDGVMHGWLRTYYNRRRRHDLSRERQGKKQCHGVLMRLEKKVLTGLLNTILLFLK